MFAQMPSLLLQQATSVHGPVTRAEERTVDVLVVDGRIDRIDEHIVAGPDTATVALAGHVLLPAAVEPHAHLDKAFLAERLPNRTGDLLGAIDAMVAGADTIDRADVVERAERALRLMARNGYVAVRTHVDVTTYTGLRNAEALIEVRRRLAGVVDLEIVALAGNPVVGASGAEQRALVYGALDLGVDLVGGCPHLEDGGLVEEATAVLLEIAADRAVGVDLHTDETLDPTATGLEHLTRQVLEGFPHRVTASHCVSLGQVEAREQARIAALVAEAGIGVITLPHTNLWLQGRGASPVPRALTAIGALRDAGAVVAAGADNLQDPFNPLGRACPLETAALMVLAAHDLPAQAWEAVSTDAAAVLGRPTAGLTPGAPAHLVAVEATSLRGAIASGGAPRRVWRHGVEQLHDLVS